MGENTQQIEYEIAAKRSDLDRNLDELEGRARELADWRTHYRQHSAAFLGAAFGTGLVLGLVAPHPRHHASRTRFDEAMGHDPLEPRQSHGVLSASASRAKQQLTETWEQVADALMRLASAKAVEIVGDFVPGFRDQFRPVRPGER